MGMTEPRGRHLSIVLVPYIVFAVICLLLWRLQSFAIACSMGHPLRHKPAGALCQQRILVGVYPVLHLNVCLATRLRAKQAWNTRATGLGHFSCSLFAKHTGITLMAAVRQSTVLSRQTRFGNKREADPLE
jgi:hypothetical protein